MANSAHVKKGDEVVVISGVGRGEQRGRIIAILPKKNRVIVEGVHMIKRHTRKNEQNPQGAIVKREGTIHISNVMRAADFDARAAKKGSPAPAAS